MILLTPCIHSINIVGKTLTVGSQDQMFEEIPVTTYPRNQVMLICEETCFSMFGNVNVELLFTRYKHTKYLLRNSFK